MEWQQPHHSAKRKQSPGATIQQHKVVAKRLKKKPYPTPKRFIFWNLAGFNNILVGLNPIKTS